MNILIINHYTGSPNYGMEYRHYYLAKEWIKLGHNVTIIGASYSHLRTIQPKFEGAFNEENIDSIKYLWIRTPTYSSSGFKRILNILIFLYDLFKYRRKIVSNIQPDIIIASSTYTIDIYPAYYISKYSKAKLIFEQHDMWPLSPIIIGGYSKYHPFIWLVQKAENFACRNSNYYVSVLHNSKKYLIQHGLSPTKFIHIPNGFSEDEWYNNNQKIPATYSTLLQQFKDSNKFIIGYAGGHEPSNALHILIHAAKRIDNEKIVFVLVGKGQYKVKLIKMAKEFNLNNIFFLPSINKSSIPNLLSYFDITFIAGVRSTLHQYGTSANKVTDYMLAGKPIIFAVDEPNSLVERVGCGIQIPAEDIDKLIKTIEYLSLLSNKERIEMGKKGYDYAIKELNYSSLARKFIESIK